MKRLLRTRVIPAAALVLAALGPLNLAGRAFTAGPPAGYSGAPGENVCTVCHNSFPLNSGTTPFSVEGPEMLIPGSSSLIKVSFQSPTTPKHGFEVTARDGAGSPSGTWQVVQTGLTKNAAGSAFHHEHTAAGTQQFTWTMRWVPPAMLPNGPITFYAAGNEANANSSASGDHIYTATTKVWRAHLGSAAVGWPIGSVQPLFLSAPGHGGELGVIVPSDDPTPVSFGGPFVLEVNPYSGFFDFALQSPWFSNLLSNLDVAGNKTATVSVPFNPSIIGLQLHFAAITADAMLNPTEVSNRITVTAQ